MTEILDQDGKRITKNKVARLAISGSDDGKDWFYIEPKDVPEWLKAKGVVKVMTDGDIVSQEDDGPYYFGEVVN